jgi:tetratricopeptide (TPR) repeat protein
LAFIADQLAACATVHAAATWLLEREPWDFLAVRYDALQAISRQFLPFLAPRQSHVSEREFELYQHVVTGFYRYYDMMLERLLQLAGPDTTVIVVSQHGVRTGDLRVAPRTGLGTQIGAWRRGNGMLAMAGPGIKSDDLVHGGSILDLAPTVLTLFGLPTAEDMEGRPLRAAFMHPPQVERIASWDIECTASRAEPAGRQPGDTEEVDGALAELAALGYEDAPGKTELALMQTTEQHRTYNLARSYFDAGRFGEAVPLLERLLVERPRARVVALALAQCRYRLGQLDECKKLVREVLDCELDGPVVSLLEANLSLLDGRIDDALAQLDDAEASGGRWPEVQCQRGRALLQMQRLEEAEQAFACALDLDADYVRGHFGLATTHLHAQRFEAAASEALECIARDFHYAKAHYVLGEALARMGRTPEAIHTFNLYLQMRPDSPSAHRWLAAIYEKAMHDQLKATLHDVRARNLEAAGVRDELQHA